ncbi:hypothetical protein BDY19DRAFT_873828, partial [Irpex rosettiformis]
KTTLTTRARIITYIETGKQLSEVSPLTRFHSSTISRVFQRYHRHHDFYTTAPRSGCPRKLDAYDDRIAAHKIRLSAAHDTIHLQWMWFPFVTPQTVRRHLCSIGLPSRHRRTKFFLMKKH